MSMFRFKVEWGGSGVNGGGVTYFDFDESGGTAAQAGSALTTFMQAVDNDISNAVTWSIDTEVARISDVDGTRVGTETVGSASGTGATGGDMSPPATQGLLRWTTGTFVNGRQVRGRTFIPGVPETLVTGGRPTSTYISDIETAAATLIASANAQLVLWSPTHQQVEIVTGASVWTEFAVLRSRRD